jgi:two-component system NtrC family sensor kinase
VHHAGGDSAGRPVVTTATTSERRRRPSLSTELVVSLGFVTSAAIVLVGLTTAAVAGVLPETLGPLVAFWLGSTVVFVLFGVYVVHRVVIRPMERLSNEADALAVGGAPAAAAAYETREFAHLAGRFRLMAADLLDVQSQIVRVEKLASIGTLAAGVAHEVRNPLGALSAYVDVVRRRGADPDVTGAMRSAIERIERTVQSLLIYARPAEPAGPADLNDAVRMGLSFLDAQGVLKGHALTVELAPSLGLVSADPQRLEQIVVNLVVNACQASPHGQVAIGTARQAYEWHHRAAARRDHGDAPAAWPRQPVRHEQWSARPRRTDVAPETPGVLLYVADDGPGVPAELRERVFDPFYTTKDPGEGTGLGLAIVARTVHESGGTVWVDRAREGGAVFKVFLPFACEPLLSPGGTELCGCSLLTTTPISASR